MHSILFSERVLPRCSTSKLLVCISCYHMPYCDGGDGSSSSSSSSSSSNTSVAFIVLGTSGVTYRWLWCYK